MAEEHRCQAPPEGPRLCVNNCGFFGSPATQGLCSKCYRDHRLEEDQEAAVKMVVEKSLQASTPDLAASSSSSISATVPSSSASVVLVPSLSLNQGETDSTTLVARPPAAAAPAPPPAPQPGRCIACRKRVGLMGFRCRCGETYCGSHRYPEQHGCTFDFKSAGRDAIARANPVVRADKLDKI